MSAFQPIESGILPLPRVNVDTDQIIPASYLKVTDKSGLADGLFAGWRYVDGRAGSELRSDFVLNDPDYRDARILLAGDNFGCGSSREHAPWALLGYGFRAVLSTSFADIFRSNSLKNGLLAIQVSPAVSERLFDLSAQSKSNRLRIDLEENTVVLPDGEVVTFEVDPFARRCILDGVDQLGYLLDQEDDIAAFESTNPSPINTLRAH